VQVANPPTASEFHGGIIVVTLRPVSGADIVSLTTDEHLLQCDSNLNTFTTQCGHSHRHRQHVETHRHTFSGSIEEKEMVRENPLCIHPKQDCSF